MLCSDRDIKNSLYESFFCARNQGSGIGGLSNLELRFWGYGSSKTFIFIGKIVQRTVRDSKNSKFLVFLRINLD